MRKAMIIMFVIITALLFVVSGISETNHSKAEVSGDALLQFDAVIADALPEVTFTFTHAGTVPDAEFIQANLYDVTIAEKANPANILQSFSCTSIHMPDPEYFARLIDLNFDGCLDLDIAFFRAATNTEHRYYLWDESLHGYTEQTLGNMTLSWYTLYPETKIISSYVHDSAATGVSEIYQWIDGELILMRRMATSQDYADGGNTYSVQLTDYATGTPVLCIDETGIPAETFLAGSGQREEQLWQGIIPGEPLAQGEA